MEAVDCQGKAIIFVLIAILFLFRLRHMGVNLVAPDFSKASSAGHGMLRLGPGGAAFQST